MHAVPALPRRDGLVAAFSAPLALGARNRGNAGGVSPRPPLSSLRRRHAGVGPLLMTAASHRPIASKLASSALRLLIKSMCTAADDLSVDIDASSNLALLSGNLNGVSVTTSRICFNQFAVSGGAAFYTDSIAISTTYPGTPLLAPPRLLKPFSVSIQATLTEQDLNREGPVRKALEALLRQIISTGLSGAVGRALPVDIGGITCVLNRVELSDAVIEQNQPRLTWRQRHPYDAGGKLILHAHATLSSGKTFRFAVRTGLCSVSDGNIVKLSDPELIWRNICVPMITIDMIGIKLEDSTKLTSVEIDQGKLSGDGIMVIAPPSAPLPSRYETPVRVEQNNGSRAPKRATGKASKTRRQLPRGLE